MLQNLVMANIEGDTKFSNDKRSTDTEEQPQSLYFVSPEDVQAVTQEMSTKSRQHHDGAANAGADNADTETVTEDKDTVCESLNAENEPGWIVVQNNPHLEKKEEMVEVNVCEASTSIPAEHDIQQTMTDECQVSSDSEMQETKKAESELPSESDIHNEVKKMLQNPQKDDDQGATEGKTQMFSETSTHETDTENLQYHSATENQGNLQSLNASGMTEERENSTKHLPATDKYKKSEENPKSHSETDVENQNIEKPTHSKLRIFEEEENTETSSKDTDFDKCKTQQDNESSAIGISVEAGNQEAEKLAKAEALKKLRGCKTNDDETAGAFYRKSEDEAKVVLKEKGHSKHEEKKKGRNRDGCNFLTAIFKRHDSYEIDDPYFAERTEAMKKYVFFWQSHDIYSQWHKSDFRVNKTTFNCAEQFMMYRKAGTIELVLFSYMTVNES